MSQTSAQLGKPPQIPDLSSVIDDSPSFHQSLEYWTLKSSQVCSATQDIASCLKDYHSTGMLHQVSGNGLAEVLSQSSQLFKGDELVEEPLVKFADTLNRIECYRSMLLTQTEMLGVEPLTSMAQDLEKTKKCRNRVLKLAESMHVSWEKLAALPHTSNLHDPQQLDRQAHQTITLKQKYQLALAEFIENVQGVNSLKKVALLQKVLEHMFAEFSYFNYCGQILKELEPYMTDLFEKLQKKQREYEQVELLNDSYRREMETKIDIEAQTKRKLFPMGEGGNTNTKATSQFFNKVGGFLSTGVKDLKKQYNGSHSKKGEEPEWEVIGGVEKSGAEENSQFYIPATSNMDVADSPEDPSEETEENTEIEDNAKSSEFCMRNSSSSVSSAGSQPTRLEQEGSFSDSASISKKGYLRISEQGRSKTHFPLLYFILDKRYGELLSQAQDQKTPIIFAPLKLSNVKPCDPSVVDRNYCFVLRTSSSEYILQASNSKDYEEWMKEIQDGIMQALDDCEPERSRTYARGGSIREEAPDKKQLVEGDVVERIKAVDGNKNCADCNCPTPGWASVNIGVVICIECSGIHRGLGVQISKIKSLSLDKWDLAKVEFMEANGNNKVNAVLEANLTVPKITRISSKSDRLSYIVDKYVNKSFCAVDNVDNGEVTSEGCGSGTKTYEPRPIETDRNITLTIENAYSDAFIDSDGGVSSPDDVVLSDSVDEDSLTLDHSVTCLVKDCDNDSHTHPPSLP